MLRSGDVDLARESHHSAIRSGRTRSDSIANVWLGLIESRLVGRVCHEVKR
jgi:hypothetical protein